MSNVDTYNRIFKVTASIVLFFAGFQYIIMHVICSGYKNIPIVYNYVITFQEILYNQSRFEIGFN